MKIAFAGAGKLGFPCALAFASRGHDVVVYDVQPHAKQILTTRKYPHREVHAQEMLETTTLRAVDTIDAAVAHADIIFVAVQTPHRPEYEGITRMPETRADFDYSSLRLAVAAIADAARAQRKYVVIDVISTVLPGTCQREIYPLLDEYTGFVYTPYFIAMGTTISDALKPEFALIGFENGIPGSQPAALELVRDFYKSVHNAPHCVMSVPSAELTKVAYNVFLGQKIVAANAVMEIAHKVGANVDDVTRALSLATDRIVSPRYMRGGMGDGGGCHPRDQIALSWLAQEIDLSYDFFGAMIAAREKQTEWLAEFAISESREGKLPIVVLGRAYKKETNLTVGSPATLLANILKEYPFVNVTQWDPYVDTTMPELVKEGSPAVYVVATDHPDFLNLKFQAGAVVVDPWGIMPNQTGVKVIRVGRS